MRIMEIQSVNEKELDNVSRDVGMRAKRLR
jgi:hypothetical protein